ncbi:MAG: metallophosphoesterase family protein [Euryarchaeota archaeon]|nr:metallophosphoesterase family protein [Euryarchaeota archaeon]
MLGVISDVHGNLPALIEVIHDMPEDVELLLCAGDVVGYNPYPCEVIQELKLHDVLCIRGNHDRAVLTDDYSRFNPYAAAAARWTRSVLSDACMEYLAGLKDSQGLLVNGVKIAMHHGAPFDEDYYVFPDRVSEELLDYDEPDILILGHTHVPFIQEYPDGVILNPGSVGQPRDGDPRASYALIDIDNWKFEIRRVEYDIDLVERKIIETGLPAFLGERLHLGH